MEKNSNVHKIDGFIEPKYYKNFTCIGSECPENCCFGWTINFLPEEVEKLKNAKCSEQLKERIDKAFIPIGDIYKVNFDECGKCPMFNNDGLCSIQLELGVDYMSETCMVYPRHFWRIGNTVFCYCNLSCYHVLDTLFNDSECMKLIDTSEGRYIAKLDFDSDDYIKKHHELKQRRQLFDFFYELISNNSYSVETAIILGLPIAERLTELIEKRLYGRIPDIIKAFKDNIDENIKTADAYEPDHEFKLKILVEIYKEFITLINVFNNIITDGKIDIAKYEEGEKKFKEAFADSPFVYRNIALNMIMELKLPFESMEHSLYENYCYFAAAFALMRIAAPAVYVGEYDPSDYEQQLKGLLAFAGRCILQGNTIVEDIIKHLKENNCTDHSHIAALLK